MTYFGIDHIVLVVADVDGAKAYYQRVLGIEAIEQKPGQWALQVGRNRISLQQTGAVPAIAINTLPGTGNFCLLTETPVAELAVRLAAEKVSIVAGPGPRTGAAGALMSVYFHDPDGNLVEVANAPA